jgi:hypothetical protein
MVGTNRVQMVEFSGRPTRSTGMGGGRILAPCLPNLLGVVVIVGTFVRVSGDNSKACIRQKPLVTVSPEGPALNASVHVGPDANFDGRREQKPAARYQYLGNPGNQSRLV